MGEKFLPHVFFGGSHYETLLDLSSLPPPPIMYTVRISPGAYVVLDQTNIIFFLQKNYIKFLVKMFLPTDSIEKVMGLTPVKNSEFCLQYTVMIHQHSKTSYILLMKSSILIYLINNVYLLFFFLFHILFWKHISSYIKSHFRYYYTLELYIFTSHFLKNDRYLDSTQEID